MKSIWNWFVLLSFVILACSNGKSGDDDAGVDSGNDSDAGADGDTDTDTDADSDEDLPTGIHELAGLDADLPYDDLAPLDSIIGGADMVGLGETIHTSGGYYIAKHRLFRYLVEEHEFRVIAFETPWGAAEQVDAYIKGAGGEVEDAVIDGLYGIWACEEVVDLVEWMRGYNDSNPSDMLSFMGMDIKQPYTDRHGLLSFLSSAAPSEQAAAETGTAHCAGVDYETWSDYQDTWSDPFVAPEILDDDYTSCMDALQAVEDYMTANHDALVTATSAEAVSRAEAHLLGLQAHEDMILYFNNPTTGSSDARDTGMAAVLLKLQAAYNPGEKVASGPTMLTSCALQTTPQGPTCW